MPSRLTIAIIVAISIAATGAQSAAANHSTLRLMSTGPGGGNGPLPADFRDVTPDGSHVFFQTVESLVPGDTDTTLDVYERVGDTTTLVSTGPSGGNGAAHATYGGATPDGAHVYFATTEALVPADRDFAADVYERFGDVTTLVSTSATDPQGFKNARFNAASADGTRVFFTTTERLVPDDQDLFEDVYERSSGTTTKLSHGNQSGTSAQFDAASADGTRVYFTASDVLLGDFEDMNEGPDVFVRSAGTTRRLTSGANVQFNAVSADGSRLIYTKTNGGGGIKDIYARSDSGEGVISGSYGGQFDAVFEASSADATSVSFTTAEPLVAQDTDSLSDVYESSGSTPRLVSTGFQGGNGSFAAAFAGASSDGSRVFFTTAEPLESSDLDGSIDVYERSGNTTALVSAGPGGGNGAFDASFAGSSSDGGRVFFYSSEKLVSGDTDTMQDIYERFPGGTTWVSFGLSGNNGNGNQDATFRGTSPDGTHVYFTTAESLVSGDHDGQRDLYEAGLAVSAAYPRPGSASPVQVPLVPAYRECIAPNGAHVAPIQAPSCDPPRLVSDFLTLGTIGQSSGFVELKALLGNPSTAEDEADIRILSFLSDVRRRSDDVDYGGDLQVSLGLRITDRRNGPTASDPATVEDQAFQFALPCTPTAGSAGGRCSLTTSADTLMPGMAKENNLTIYDVGKVEVFDGGADDDAETSPNMLFATEGVFAP